MRRFFPSLLAALVVCLCFGSPAAAQSGSNKFKIGEHYSTLAAPAMLTEPDDGRIEVVAFFWYGCGSCFVVDDTITKWAAKLPKDVRFVRRPMIGNPSLDLHGQIFFALRQLGLDHKADMVVFDLFQNQRRPVRSVADLGEVAKALKISEADFKAAFDSKEVKAEMANLEKLMKAYDIPGVPSMVINGKYHFDIGTTNGVDGMLELSDILIKSERR